MYNFFKAMGYFALIGVSLLAACVATRDNRPGQIVEDDDELGYRWEPNEFKAANDE